MDGGLTFFPQPCVCCSGRSSAETVGSNAGGAKTEAADESTDVVNGAAGTAPTGSLAGAGLALTVLRVGAKARLEDHEA